MNNRENAVSNANNLLKRIDESFFFVVDADGQQQLNKLLEDCRAEIERLSKPYVPMTDVERNEMMAVWHENADLPPMIQYIEATVIKRAGLRIKHD